jgi:carboxyl-terminal processing protease
MTHSSRIERQDRFGRTALTYLSRLCIGIALALTVGSCTPRLSDVIDQPGVPESVDRGFIGKAADIYYAGFGAVADGYVDAIEPATLALASLNGVERLDDKVRMVQRANRIAIHYDNRSIAELVVPERDDVSGWAQTTALAVETARRSSTKLAQATESMLFEATFDSMTESLDRYSRYENELEGRVNKASRQGYSGIGAGLVQNTEPASVAISKVFEGSPAAEAGVREGDIIGSVDGTSTQNLDVEEVANLMRGPVGTLVRIRFYRENQNIDLEIRRDQVIEPTVFYQPVGDVAYVRISYFNIGTTEGLREKIAQAKAEIPGGMKGLILDLRQNRGGNLSQSLEVADLFIEEGQLLLTNGRTIGSRRSYVASANDDINHLPMVVLIDGGSASASEIVASALQDSNRALVIGTRSFGKGTIQNIVELPNQSYLIFTSARMHAPSGYTLSHFGVFPSICTQDSYGADDGSRTDLQLDQIASNKALQLRRRADQLGKAEKSQLETYCTGDHPPSSDDSDVRIASRLLHSAELYRQAAAASQVAFRAGPANPL